ncbi:nucleoside deaminase [Leifsonia poae]|uniref:nucleoside deaminase n=1 Tax=Leifsonia poae TaxID=110933 RepID=UPI001CBD2844|nr:nucleoside deaminase [Leifsonia poae]
MTDPTTVSPTDETVLRRAIEVARLAREAGSHPFGAVLVTAGGATFEAQNSVGDGDPTGHAETNLVRLVSIRLSREELRTSALYASTEPCAMCAGAIYWSGIGRVVYALPEQALAALVPAQDGEPTLDLPCREVFARGGQTVTVAGPALLPEATAVHAGFWESL